MLRTIVAVSDLHGILPAIPSCDLLLIAGDITPVTNHAVDFQVQWLDTEFRAWLEEVPAKQAIFIAGNHDFVFESRPELVPSGLRAMYLQDSVCEWEGMKIWGTPWQPWFFDWAFNLPESELKAKWDLIPEGIDILIVHGPPLGYGDGIPERRGIRHAGSPSLLARIQAIKPGLVVFGHIHEGTGQWRVGETILANVTLMDAHYNHAYPPWILQMDGGA